MADWGQKLYNNPTLYSFLCSECIIDFVRKFNPKEYTELIDITINGKVLDIKKPKQLLAIIIGENPESLKYVSLKHAYCDKVGISFLSVNIPSSSRLEDIIILVTKKFNDPKVGGGIIQLPIPLKNPDQILSLIPTKKDIDLISPESMENFYKGEFSTLSPVIRALNCFLFDSTYQVDKNTFLNLTSKKQTYFLTKTLKNKHFVVIGAGYLVGKPIIHYLKNFSANVETLKKYQKGHRIDADFLILATDIPNLVTGDVISSGTNVVDFGSSIVKVDGQDRVVGNLNIASKIDHLGCVAFSPGGVGPLVIRMLVSNFLDSTN